MSQTLPFRRFLLWGQAGAMASAASAGRDARIDVIRGLALLVIFINHMPGNILAGWMPHNFGFSDAADAFVLLAGLSATLAYGSVMDKRGFVAGTLRIAARLRTLYLAHIAVFLIVCGVVATAVTRTQNPLYIEAINIQPIFSAMLPAVLDAMALVYQPSYLDILPLYIVLLALFPLIYRAVQFSPLLTLAASVAVWQGAVLFGLNLPNTGSGGWFFNPFAWQLIFTIGVVLGRIKQTGVAVPRLWWLDVAAIGFVAFAFIVKISSGNPFGIAAMNDWIDTVQLGTDKTNLAWVRIAHLLAMTWLAVRILPGGLALLSVAAGRRLSAMGRHSLEVFCVATVLSIVGQIVLAETSFVMEVQLLVCVIGATVLMSLGAFLTWYKSVERPNTVMPSSSREVDSALSS